MTVLPQVGQSGASGKAGPSGIVCGVDEAGYGPLLGPLVVSLVAFEAPVSHGRSNWWNLLRRVVCDEATGRQGRRRLPVCDSKRLHSGREKLARLERSALTFLGLGSGEAPRRLSALLEQLCPEWPSWSARCPWFAGRDLSLPQAADADDIRTQRAAVRGALGECGIVPRGVSAVVLPAVRYNELVAATRNKSAVAFWAVTSLISRVLSVHPHLPSVFLVDRQGGRVSYARDLMRSFEADSLQIEAEDERTSRYLLNHRPHLCEVGFYVEGESRYFAIALASIISKYLREMCMLLFNGWWGERIGEERPTAGYYLDAMRFLERARPHFDRLGVRESELVRQR